MGWLGLGVFVVSDGLFGLVLYECVGARVCG